MTMALLMIPGFLSPSANVFLDSPPFVFVAWLAVDGPLKPPRKLVRKISALVRRCAIQLNRD